MLAGAPGGPSRSSRTAPARRWSATWRRCTATGCGPPCSRTSERRRDHRPRRCRPRARAATTSSCSTAWVGELARLVAPDRAEPADPIAAMVGLDADAGPPRRPGAAAAVPRRVPRRRGCRRRSSVGTPSTTCASAKAQRARGGAGEPERSSPARADARPGRRRRPGPGSGCLNDLRLVLGTRLGVTDEAGGRGPWPDDDDPRAPAMVAYHWLTYLQDTLVEALSPAAPVAWTGADHRPGHLDAIVAHARRDHPDEACGVVAGAAGSDRPTRFVPMVNAARSPTFYEFDSMDLLRLYREMDDRDEEPVVIYHSHTADRGLPVAHRRHLRLRAERPLRAGLHRRPGRPSSSARSGSWTAWSRRKKSGSSRRWTTQPG